MKKPILVFTEEQTDLWVYYESDTFWHLKQMLDAVETAKTWGEFRSLLPEGVSIPVQSGHRFRWKPATHSV